LKWGRKVQKVKGNCSNNIYTNRIKDQVAYYLSLLLFCMQPIFFNWFNPLKTKISQQYVNICKSVKLNQEGLWGLLMLLLLKQKYFYFVGYFMLLVVSRLHSIEWYDGKIRVKWRGYGRKRSWHSQDIVLVFLWSD
jgi:hypothetical protein